VEKEWLEGFPYIFHQGRISVLGVAVYALLMMSNDIEGFRSAGDCLSLPEFCLDYPSHLDYKHTFNSYKLLNNNRSPSQGKKPL
jgi:hypothetical protein